MNSFFEGIGCLYKQNIPLKTYTTFAIGGNAEYLVFPETEAQVLSIYRYIEKHDIPCHILGKGSNLLVSDAGISGIVLSTRYLNSIRTDADQIEVGAGVPLGKLLSLCQKQGFTGLEELVGIPGTVGGAITMNAGAHQKEISQAVRKITFFDQKTFTVQVLTGEEFSFGYRHSLAREREGIVLRAAFRLGKGKQEDILAKMQKFAYLRKQKQPLDYPNAGSVFKRPFPYYAPRLIEEANLKGAKIGNAQISPKHAGFILNLGNAKAEDVKALITYTQNQVFSRFSIHLVPEIVFWGNFSN